MLPTEHKPSSDPFLEISNAFAQYLKYLTTLSTGSIILQIAFIERVFAHPKWKAVLILSLLSFTVSIVAAVAAYTMIIMAGEDAGRGIQRRTIWGPKNEDAAGELFLVITWSTFLAGILFLVVFSLRNLFALS